MNNKQKVIDKLKAKTINDYSSEYWEAEEKLIGCLKEMPNYNKSCNCDECEQIKLIHQGFYDEIIRYCLACGGTLE